MTNPLLTVAFDLMLIGTAVCVIAAMVAEQRTSREPAVGKRLRRAAPVAAKRVTPKAVRSGLSRRAA
jgi:hypothetical protein